MSAGQFTRTFYQTSTENGGYILACRVQPETLQAVINGATNSAPAGPVTAPGSATISQGRRSAGVNMRYVTLQWVNDPPTGYSGDPVRIPVLRPATFAEWTDRATGSYLGQAVRVIGRTSETIK